MDRKSFSHPPFPVWLALLLVAAAGAVVLAGCGGSSDTAEPSSTNLTSTVTTTISDPPTCKGPGAPSDLQFDNVWVTVTLVRAHISSDAGGNDGGWVTLVDLTNNPLQIDLLAEGSSQCILAVLGSTTALPAGNYQQIRIHLLANNPPSGTPTPSPNNCASVNGFNCAQESGGPLKRLELSSQAQTGIKIPPGRIAGGAIMLEAGQTADINIEFSACNSIVEQGNGQLRLLPTLHAGEVSTADALSGRIVDRDTGNPIADATALVFLEQPDSDGIDRPVMTTMADSNTGTFSFCPVPVGTFDIVAAAMSGAGVTYNATILFNVSNGANVGDIPLEPETGENTSPGTLDGLVTSAGMSGAISVDVSLAPLQEGTPSGGSARLVTIPTFGASTLNVATEAGMSCPMGTNCANYTLNVPASNPVVGTFSSGGTTYADPAAGDILYQVNARAFVTGTTTPTCSPSSVTKNMDNMMMTLKVTPGGTTTVEQIDFTGCTNSSP